MARICSWSSSLKERVSYKFWKQCKNSLHKFHGRLTRCMSVSPRETWWNLVEVRSFTRRHYQSNSYMLVKLVKAFPLSFQSSFPYEGEDVSLASQIRLHEIKKRLHIFLKTSACFLNSCWNFYSCTFKITLLQKTAHKECPLAKYSLHLHRYWRSIHIRAVESLSTG